MATLPLQHLEAMYDPEDIILYLVPHPGEGFDNAVFATAMPANKSRRIPGHLSDASTSGHIPCREERAGTEPPIEFRDFGNTDSLVLRFSDGAKTSRGVVCGWAKAADLTFPNTPGVSRHHLAFTFDDHNQPIARDLDSRYGTTVVYYGQEMTRLSNFDWPLTSPAIMGARPPILKISSNLQFKVIIPTHDITSPSYIQKVETFRRGKANPEDLFASLLVESVRSTQHPSGQQTPCTNSSRPILYKKNIGEGYFGTVSYVWNLTTGEEYVVKEPRKKKISRYQFKIWKREADIMRTIHHPHIVAFRGASFSDGPRLEFEYVPGGSLDSAIYRNLSTSESTHILSQLCSALIYLHNQNPAIGHRDIKPENILVVKRDGSGIYVKFADFGLSKAATLLQSFCGTPTYLAPEIYLKAADPKGTAEDTYGVAVDVWSLGVVVASLECGGLPEYRAEWTTDTTAWVTIVRDYVCDEYQRQDSALLYMIVDNMLVIDPDERSSADFCYDEAQRLLPCNGEPDNSGNASRTPISLVGLANAEDTTYSSDASTIRPYSSPCGLGSGGTIIKAEHSLGSHSRCAGRTKPNVPSKRDAQALTGRSSKLRLSRNSITHNSGAGTYVKYGDTTSRHLETPNLSSTICKTKTPCSLGHVSRSRS